MNKWIAILALLLMLVIPAYAQDGTAEPTAAAVETVETAPEPVEAPAPIIITDDGSTVNWSYVFNIVLLLVVLVQQFLATGKLAPEKVQQIIDRARAGAVATKDNPYDDIAVTIGEAVAKALIAQQIAMTPPAVSPQG